MKVQISHYLRLDLSLASRSCPGTFTVFFFDISCSTFFKSDISEFKIFCIAAATAVTATAAYAAAAAVVAASAAAALLVVGRVAAQQLCI